LVLGDAGPVWFAWVVAAENAVAALALAYTWRKHGRWPGAWQWQRRSALSMLKVSWPLAASGLSIGLYMRLDQVLVRIYLGDAQLGLYAVAVRIAELWFFVPMAVGAAAFPQLVGLRAEKGEAAFEAGLVKLFRALVYGGLAAALLIAAVGPWAVRLLYGPAYAGCAPVLVVLAWSGIFVGLGIAKEHWLILKGLAGFSFASTLGGAALNLVLNLLWLPRFGAVGTAYATVCSQATASMFVLSVHPRTRRVFWLQVRAFAPWGA
jgi:PST family polysaccharide transporter